MTLSAADAIFLALADVQAADRAAALDARCGGDAALRAEVEAMIAALAVPDDDFLDPEHLPTLDMASVDGPLQPGTRLGDFLVLHALGSGGMGVVYAAQQDRPCRTVAIKVVRRGFRQHDILRRFEREAELLGRLQHPGIAQVHSFHPGDGRVPAHLVMELVSGPPITEFARARQLPTSQRVSLAMKLCDAVQHAHERGIIHRDLKPANVLVADDGQPKVLDFGIARGTDVQRITLQTASGQFMGTLAYMSPEQLRGSSTDVDAQSDVYALGVLFYRLFSDRLPFDLSDIPWIEAVQRVLETEPLPLGEANPALAGPLEHIVARAMERDRGRRYRTAAEIALDLQGYLEGRSPAIAPPSGRPAGVADDRARVARMPPPAVQVAAASALIIATRDDRVIRWSLTDNREAWSVLVGPVRSLAVSANRCMIVAGLATSAIELLNTDTGGQIGSLKGHATAVHAVAVSDDGEWLASAAVDGEVRIWNATNMSPTSTSIRREGPASLTWLSDGRLAVAWNDGQVDVISPTAE